MILKAEFCLDRKQNNLCFYQTNVKDAKAQLCSALENGENIKDATVIFYMQINLYWQILDYWKNDHKITSFSTTGMEFTWNGRSLEQSIPNTPLFPLKTPNEIGKAQKSLPLGFIPVVREGFLLVTWSKICSFVPLLQDQAFKAGIYNSPVWGCI